VCLCFIVCNIEGWPSNNVLQLMLCLRTFSLSYCKLRGHASYMHIVVLYVAGLEAGRINNIGKNSGFNNVL
jgi:hypothetical protein